MSTIIKVDFKKVSKKKEEALKRARRIQIVNDCLMVFLIITLTSLLGFLLFCTLVYLEK